MPLHGSTHRTTLARTSPTSPQITSDDGPESRTIPRSPWPGGEATATMVADASIAGSAPAALLGLRLGLSLLEGTREGAAEQSLAATLAGLEQVHRLDLPADAL